MAGHSRQGYTPIPTEERVSVDIDDNREDVEVSDDELDISNSDPLLSRSQREPHILTSSRMRTCSVCLKRWNPFQATIFHPARWRMPQVKQQKQNKVMKWTIVVMAIIIVGLVPAVAVLGVKVRDGGGGYTFCPNYDQTRVPRFGGGGSYAPSANFRLNFPELYPPLSSPQGSACRQAWESLKYVNCHEKIWNRAWDDGKRSLFDPEMSDYVQAVCGSACTERLQQAYQLISSKCTKGDRFVLQGYVGTFTADPGLEDGPVAVLETILRRLTHTCRRSPSSNQYPFHYDRPYCTSNVYQNWFIIDGMNAGNLEGLDVFDTLTSNSSQLSGGYPYYYWNGANCDNIHRDFSYARGPRRVGPGTGETECGWCLLNWFDRKLLGWKKDAVFDPKDGSAVDLPDYLRRIRTLGSRCEVEDWNAIYWKAIDYYKSSGQLPKDWNDSKN